MPDPKTLGLAAEPGPTTLGLAANQIQ